MAAALSKIGKLSVVTPSEVEKKLLNTSFTRPLSLRDVLSAEILIYVTIQGYQLSDSTYIANVSWMKKSVQYRDQAEAKQKTGILRVTVSALELSNKVSLGTKLISYSYDHTYINHPKAPEQYRTPLASNEEVRGALIDRSVVDLIRFLFPYYSDEDVPWDGNCDSDLCKNALEALQNHNYDLCAQLLDQQLVVLKGNTKKRQEREGKDEALGSVYYNLGLASEAQGKLDDALKHYGVAFEVQKKDPPKKVKKGLKRVTDLVEAWTAYNAKPNNVSTLGPTTMLEDSQTLIEMVRANARARQIGALSDLPSFPATSGSTINNTHILCRSKHGKHQAIHVFEMFYLADKVHAKATVVSLPDGFGDIRDLFFYPYNKILISADKLYSLDLATQKLSTVYSRFMINPVLSPDARYIVFTTDAGISLLGIDSSVPHVLYPNKGSLYPASWAADNLSFSFADSNRVYVASASGDKISSIDYSLSNPILSPDGTHVASTVLVQANEISLMDVVLGNLETGQFVNITNDPMYYGNPSWSPDSQWIVFDSSPKVDFKNLAGTDLGASAIQEFSLKSRKLYTVLKGDLKHLQYPSWSPDGSKILFQTGSINENTEIYIMNPNGSDVQNITNSPYNELEPTWSRF